MGGTEKVAWGNRRKGEVTREALMDAGFRVFAKKGYLRAQIGEIAREASKSSGVFHIYFTNKEALLDAWVDRCDGTVNWYWADTDLLFEKARPFVLKSYWSLYERFGPIIDALEAAALVSDHFARRRRSLRKKGDASIARMIRHAQGDGRFAGIDPELTAISIAAVLTEVTAYWFRNRGDMESRGVDEHRVLEHLQRAFAVMLESGSAASVSDPAAVSGAVNSGARP